MIQRIAQLFAAALVFSFAPNALANPNAEYSTETLFKASNASGENIFILRYHEEGLWHVREIVQHPDGWQDTVSHRVYKKLSSSEKAQSALQTKYPSLQPLAVSRPAEPLQLMGGSIWPTTQTWNWEWEKKYAEWLSTEMNIEFFKKYNIATDCADVAYSARWIFSRIHGLPAANHLGGTNALFTNQSLRAEWASLPTAKNWYEDRRFRAALNYLLNEAYTHLLMRDSYPVAINADNFLPGIHSLNLHEASGHTQLVHRVNLAVDTLPFLIIQSTTPRAVRVLNESLYWGTELPKKGQSGFLRILWPKVQGGTYILEKPEKMPGYSLEQYDPAFVHDNRPFSIEVYLRLDSNLNFVQLFKTSLANIYDAIQARIPIVEDGYKKCANKSCPEGSAGFEEWSTPSRDAKISQMMNQMEMLRGMTLPGNDTQEIEAFYQQEIKRTYLVLNQKEYSLKTLEFLWNTGLISADPNDEPNLRWPLEPGFFASRLVAQLNAEYEKRKVKMEVRTDEQIKYLYTISGNYCYFFTESDCTLYQQELTKNVRLIGQDKTLQQWLELGFWLNADPKQSREYQWGGLREKSKFQILTRLQEFQVTAAGIGLFAATDTAKRIGPMSKDGLQDTPLPAGFTWQLLDQKSSVGYAFQDGFILRHDFIKGTESTFTTVAQKVKSAILLEGGRLVAISDNHIWNLSLATPATQVVWEKDISVAGSASETHMIAVHPQGGVFLLDLNSGAEIPLPAGSEGMNIAFEDQKYFGLGLSTRSGLLIEKATGKFFEVPQLRTIIAWSPLRTKAVATESGTYSRKLYQLSFDENFQIVKKEPLGEMQDHQGDFFAMKTDGAKASLYKFESEQLKLQPLLSDEISVSALLGPWIETKLSEKIRRLRSFDGKKIIYEGPKYHIMTGEQSADTYLLEYGENFIEGGRLITTANMQAPALMTGFFGSDYMMFGGSGKPMIKKVDRGVIVSHQGRSFWAEFP
jgi:hypothetical protein